MGTLEDIMDRDRETQAAIARVNEAVKRDTFNPTDQGLHDIHIAVDAAKTAVRVEQASLRAVLAKLEALDAETMARLRERAEADRRRAAGGASPSYIESAGELDRLAQARRPPPTHQTYPVPPPPATHVGFVPVPVTHVAYRPGVLQFPPTALAPFSAGATGSGPPPNAPGAGYVPPAQRATSHPLNECDVCAEAQRRGTPVGPHFPSRERIQESRYAAPSLPDNDRYQDFLREHGEG